MRSQKSREVAWTGMLFALAIALSFLESAITPLLGLMPAMKLGLSNLVVMYALLFLNTRTAAELVLLKALFALLTRGPTAGFLSLCGGVLSFLVLWGLLHLPASPGEFIFTVSGALAHNIGQLLGASVLLSSTMALGYAPVLLVGFLGAFTTFSTFALESANLMQAGAPWKALLNIGLQNLSGLAAVCCGLWLVRQFCH